jgi:hypothetical protein
MDAGDCVRGLRLLTWHEPFEITALALRLSTAAASKMRHYRTDMRADKIRAGKH